MDLYAYAFPCVLRLDPPNLRAAGSLGIDRIRLIRQAFAFYEAEHQSGSCRAKDVLLK